MSILSSLVFVLASNILVENLACWCEFLFYLLWNSCQALSVSWAIRLTCMLVACSSSSSPFCCSTAFLFWFLFLSMSVLFSFHLSSILSPLNWFWIACTIGAFQNCIPHMRHSNVRCVAYHCSILFPLASSFFRMIVSNSGKMCWISFLCVSLRRRCLVLLTVCHASCSLVFGAGGLDFSFLVLF